MSIFDPYIFSWSIVIHNREFLISVDHDGSTEWLELAALQKAGGERHASDFIGTILGDYDSASRAKHRLDEFRIRTEPSTADLDLMAFAANHHEDENAKEGLEPALDHHFEEMFWEYVNPQLPDPLTKA